MSVYPQQGVTVIQPGYGQPVYGQPGYGPPPPQTNVTVGYAQPPPPQTQVVTMIQQPTQAVPGTCRGCGAGTFRDTPTAFGILCAIFFFPFGIIFCLLDMEKKCSVCGLTYR